MLIYAIGDIHGCIDELRIVYDKVKADAGDKEHVIITTGDYVDRGPDSKACVQFLIDHMRIGKDYNLMGNHEDMLLANIREFRPEGQDVWEKQQMGAAFFMNGGKQTMQSYDIPWDHPDPVSQLPPAHIDWFTRLHQCVITDRHMFVHAGIDPTRPVDQQHRNQMMWIRDEFLRCKFPFERYIVHGHTPIGYDPLRPPQHLKSDPVILTNRVNLDTGACFGGKLTCAVFDPNINEPINIIQN